MYGEGNIALHNLDDVKPILHQISHHRWPHKLLDIVRLGNCFISHVVLFPGNSALHYNLLQVTFIIYIILC